jgi:hypothetical protein
MFFCNLVMAGLEGKAATLTGIKIIERSTTMGIRLPIAAN